MPAIAASDRTREPETPAAPLAAQRKGWVRGFFFWALSLFLLGMGMKLIMMEPCLNALPYYDQWEAEGAEIYVPYYQHTLRFLSLFHAQNEHRIFFTHGGVMAQRTALLARLNNLEDVKVAELFRF